MSFWSILLVHAGLGATAAVLDRWFSGPDSRLKKNLWIVGHSWERKFSVALIILLLTMVGSVTAGQLEFAKALVLLIPEAFVLVLGMRLAELGIAFHDRTAQGRNKVPRIEVLPPTPDTPELSAAPPAEPIELETADEAKVRARREKLDNRLDGY